MPNTAGRSRGGAPNASGKSNFVSRNFHDSGSLARARETNYRGGDRSPRVSMPRRGDGDGRPGGVGNGSRDDGRGGNFGGRGGDGHGGNYDGHGRYDGHGKYGGNNRWYGGNNSWYGGNNRWYGGNNSWYGGNRGWYGYGRGHRYGGYYPRYGFGFYPWLGWGLGWPNYYGYYGLPFGIGYGYGLGYCGWGGYGGGYAYPYNFGYYGTYYGNPATTTYAYADAADDQPVLAEQPLAADAAAPADEAPTAEELARASEYIGLGEQAFQAGQYEDALRDWQHSMVDNPDNGAVLLLMAQALFALGKYDASANTVQMAMQMLPEDEWGGVVGHYSEIYPDIQKYTDQIRVAEKARDAEPDDGAIRFLLGYNFGYLNYPKQAVHELDKALDIEPRDAGAEKLREIFAKQAGLPARPPAVGAGDAPEAKPAAPAKDAEPTPPQTPDKTDEAATPAAVDA